MQKDYYQNILYPFQNKILGIIGSLDVDFYLTGGTALSRAYLHHRYSDDLDFFVNRSLSFKKQVEKFILSLAQHHIKLETKQAYEDFVRLTVFENDAALKIDFVNDVLFRFGEPLSNPLFRLTDNIRNILSNKIAALSRQMAKDVVDIIFICQVYNFNWTDAIAEASEKDMWVNPVEIANILDSFSPDKIKEINWINEIPDEQWFMAQLSSVIRDILQGNANSLYKQ